MIEQIRLAIQVASSVAEVPRKQAERFAKQLSGELKGSQVSAIAEDIVKRSKENAQIFQTLVTSEIKRQMRSMGLATREDLDRTNRRVFSLASKEEVDRLSKRLTALETASQKAKAAPRKTTAKPSTGTRAKPRPKSAGSRTSAGSRGSATPSS